MISAKRKLNLKDDKTPSPAKKFKFFTPERFRSPSSSSKSDNNHPNKLEKLTKPILECHLSDFTSVKGIELYLITKCGLEKTMMVFQSLCHVPEGFPLRLNYVSNILVAAELDSLFDDLQLALQHIDKFCYKQSVYLNVPVSKEILWKASILFKITHMGFLMPKAETCLEDGCGGKLYGSQKDSIQVTVFTMNGPMPYLKVTLKCRSCGSR